jgi:hypothetical protein
VKLVTCLIIVFADFSSLYILYQYSFMAFFIIGFPICLLGGFIRSSIGVCIPYFSRIRNTYVVPRFLYGLEVQNPTKTDIKKLEQLQRKVCRQFQCLPERTSSIAVYALNFVDKQCIICIGICGLPQ